MDIGEGIRQNGSISQNATVRIPARSSPRLKPPIPEKRSRTFIVNPKLAFTVLVTHLFKDTLDSVFYGFHTSRCFFRITSILCILDSHKLIQERLPYPTHRHSSFAMLTHIPSLTKPETDRLTASIGRDEHLPRVVTLIEQSISSGHTRPGLVLHTNHPVFPPSGMQ